MGGWMTLLDVVTALGQVMLNLSLGPDIYSIHRRKSIGELSVAPLVSMLVNCHLWMCYGILRDSLFPVAATQGFGQLAAIVFNVIYFKWSPPQARKDNIKLYVIGIVIYCIVTLYFVLVLAGVTGQTNYDGSILMGYAGVAINLCLFVSPLTTLKRVVETKSAASIPINVSIMMFASSVLWVITGLLDSDYFITSLNLAGVAFGASQMVLYHIYHPGRGVNALPDQQYGANGELPVVVSPTSKDAGVVVTIESPAYKPIASPALGKTV